MSTYPTSAKQRAVLRDELARRRLIANATEQTLDQATKDLFLIEELDDAREILEAMQQQLIEKLEQVEALLLRPRKHWQKTA